LRCRWGWISRFVRVVGLWVRVGLPRSPN